jgi:dienelactone hydrolase
MRTGEALIIILNLLALISFDYGHPWPDSAAAIVSLVVCIHLVVEKSRWQMIPAYAVSGGVVALGLAGAVSSFRSNHAVELMAAVTLLTSALLSIVLPVFSLPRPSGRHPIGTVTRVWTRTISPQDSSEPARRKLTVQFWYPAQAASGRRSPYRAKRGQGLKSHLGLVRTHSFVKAPMISGVEKCAVVLFSPGWKGHLTQNSIQFEMLASHGFTVVSVEHPPAERLPADFDPSLQENLDEYPREARLRAEDMSYVLDRLEEINAADPEDRFTDRFDMSQVGMFGYSFGGAVAVETCWLDERVKAGINMDGMLFGEAADAGISKPFFFMSCDGPLPSEEELQCGDARKRLHMQMLDLDIRRIRRSLARYGGYYLTVRGSAHSNYSDRPLYSPLKRLTDAGPVNPKTAFEIINHYVLAFFDQYLRGNRQDCWREDCTRHPAVDLLFHTGPPAVSTPQVA